VLLSEERSRVDARPPAADAQPLFRVEAIESRSARLSGAVVLRGGLGGWVLTALLVGTITAAFVYASLATYARTETVSGVVMPVQPMAKVVAPRPGLVARLHVQEGDRVKAGQLLAEIRIEQPDSAGQPTSAAGLNAIAAQRELAAERLALSPDRLRAEQARLAAVIKGARQQQDQLRGQLALQRDLVALTRSSFQQIEKLVEKGFVTRLELDRRRQAWIQAEQTLISMEQQFDGTAVTIETARADLSRAAAEYASVRADILASMEQLEVSRSQMSAQQGYAVLAPIAGRVSAIQAAAGRFADGRVPLLSILPEGTKMRVDLYAPSRSMGFLRPGQPVRLLYDAFPWQRFGAFDGTIAEVSQTILAPTEVDAALKLEEPVYRVRVAVKDQAITAFGTSAPLQPGMTLEANIVLERQTFLDWLLTPLRAVELRR
jgi:membrane fusion protein